MSSDQEHPQASWANPESMATALLVIGVFSYGSCWPLGLLALGTVGCWPLGLLAIMSIGHWSFRQMGLLAMRALLATEAGGHWVYWPLVLLAIRAGLGAA